uniref:Kelch-like protein diablo n=1 Tax=Clastoptera arizonana TaxID=38151 RepID=A0A1B6C072_9HEMI
MLSERSKYMFSRTLDEEITDFLSSLKQSDFLSDAVIVLGNESYPVHKTILASSTQFFEGLFRSEPSTNIFNIESIDENMFKMILDHAYMKKIKIDRNNVSALLLTADYLGIKDITRQCVKFIEEGMDLRNCFHIMRFARDHSFADLEKEAYNYIIRNFEIIAKDSPELLSTSLEEFQEIISSPDLNVRNESIVWEVILTWIDQDMLGRREHLPKLMKNIRLGLMEWNYFLDKVKDHPFVISDDSCRPIIKDTLKFIYDMDSSVKDEITTPTFALPRNPHEVMFVIGGWSGGRMDCLMETYDSRSDRWTNVRKCDPLGPWGYIGTAVLDHDIYVIGGFNGVEFTNSCRCFNAVTQIWREIGPMHEKRGYVSVVVLDGFIYAMGGNNGRYNQNTVEKYDPAMNQWSFVQSMVHPRSKAGATVLNGNIYIAGGFNGMEVLRSVEVYDPKADKWSMVCDMTSRRSGLSCIAYHGSVYVLGGFNGMFQMKSGEKLHPFRGYWNQIPDMIVARSNFGVEVIDDMVFVIGGYNGHSSMSCVECFDDKKKEWYNATNMNINRSGLSACVVTGLPNLQPYIYKNRDLLFEEKRQQMRMDLPEQWDLPEDIPLEEWVGQEEWNIQQDPWVPEEQWVPLEQLDPPQQLLPPENVVPPIYVEVDDVDMQDI